MLPLHVENTMLALCALVAHWAAYTGLRWLGVSPWVAMTLVGLMALSLVLALVWNSIRPHTRPQPSPVEETFSAMGLLRAQRRRTLTSKEQLLVLAVNLEKQHHPSRVRYTEDRSAPPSVSVPGTWSVTIPTADHARPRLVRDDAFEVCLGDGKHDDYSDTLGDLDLSFIPKGHTWKIELSAAGNLSSLSDRKRLHAVILEVHDATLHKAVVRRWNQDRRWWFQRPPSTSNALATTAR